MNIDNSESVICHMNILNKEIIWINLRKTFKGILYGIR